MHKKASVEGGRLGAVMSWAGAISWAGVVLVWAVRILKVKVGPTDQQT